jgi:predicted Zn-dependent protease
VRIYGAATNYQTLGLTLAELRQYPQAKAALNRGLTYGSPDPFDVNLALAELAIVYGEPAQSEQFIRHSILIYPREPRLWIDLALLQGSHGNKSGAKDAILHAAALGHVSQKIYDAITNDTPISVTLSFINR